jgi:hypothetical protein
MVEITRNYTCRILTARFTRAVLRQDVETACIHLRTADSPRNPQLVANVSGASPAEETKRLAALNARDDSPLMRIAHHLATTQE